MNFGKYAEGPCVFHHAGMDFAIIKAEVGYDAKNMVALPMAGPEDYKWCQPVLAVGSPQGLVATATQGIISSPKPRMMRYQIETGQYAQCEMLQTDAAVNPGNSGGPIVNRRGEMVGVTNMKWVHTSVEGLAFLLPMKSVLKLIEEAIQQGKIATAMSLATRNPFIDSELDKLVELLHSQGGV